MRPKKDITDMISIIYSVDTLIDLSKLAKAFYYGEWSKVYTVGQLEPEMTGRGTQVLEFKNGDVMIRIGNFEKGVMNGYGILINVTKGDAISSTEPTQTGQIGIWVNDKIDPEATQNAEKEELVRREHDHIKELAQKIKDKFDHYIE